MSIENRELARQCVVELFAKSPAEEEEIITKLLDEVYLDGFNHGLVQGRNSEKKSRQDREPDGTYYGLFS